MSCPKALCGVRTEFKMKTEVFRKSSLEIHPPQVRRSMALIFKVALVEPLSCRWSCNNEGCALHSGEDRSSFSDLFSSQCTHHHRSKLMITRMIEILQSWNFFGTLGGPPKVVRLQLTAMARFFFSKKGKKKKGLCIKDVDDYINEEGTAICVL